jgi:hypothetical protein
MAVTHLRSLVRRVAIAAAAVACAISVTDSPAHAEAAVGYVRLAHLSPDTGKVDVYLSKVGDSSFTEQVFQHVGYGVMSKYLALPVGSYAVAMRNEGDPASSPPVLTTSVTVDAGAAYTVAGVGKHAVLGLKVLTDDLSRPAGKKAKVRIIQASVAAPVLDVDLTDGTSLAKAVNFASTTAYQVVDPGAWTLKLHPTGSSVSTTLSANLAAGSVYSLLVLDGADGLTLELLADARGGAEAPDGGVEAGAGGSTPGYPLAMIGIGAVLVLGLVLLAVRMRRLANRRS